MNLSFLSVAMFLAEPSSLPPEKITQATFAVQQKSPHKANPLPARSSAGFGVTLLVLGTPLSMIGEYFISQLDTPTQHQELEESPSESCDKLHPCTRNMMPGIAIGAGVAFIGAGVALLLQGEEMEKIYREWEKKIQLRPSLSWNDGFQARLAVQF